MIVMKSTGIVRRVDELGRIVIPIELRRTLNIMEKDTLEIFVNDDHIILKKYQTDQTCHVTGIKSEDNLSLAEGKLVLDRDAAKQIISEIHTELDK